MALLGLLEPPIPDEPSGAPHTVNRVGNWDVSHFSDAVKWQCRCDRSPPILLRPQDSERVLLPYDGVHACEVCRDQIKSARTKSQRFAAWIEQHRAVLDPSACLEFPFKTEAPSTPTRQRYSRTRKFIFEQFWKKTVGPDHYVHLRCKNELCINPYHLCLTKLPNPTFAKLSPKGRRLIQILDQRGLSTTAIRVLLREKLSIELSERSIARIRRDLTESKSCAF